jgi:hypothetical protein
VDATSHRDSARRRAELDAKVADFHEASDGVYGAPRILADLRAAGTRVSRKTVAASLRRQGPAGISLRRFAPATTVVPPTPPGTNAAREPGNRYTGTGQYWPTAPVTVSQERHSIPRTPTGRSR